MIEWYNNQLLQNVTQTQLKEITPYLQTHHYKENQVIIREGEEGDRLYMIESGEVEIYKDGITLAYQEAGEHFGVMALLDETKRSANVKATKATQLKSIDTDAIKTLSGKAEESIFFKIMLNHVTNQQAALRTMNIATIKETKEKLEEAKKNISFSNFFLFTLTILISYMFLLGVFLEWKEHIHTQFYLSCAVPLIIATLGIACYRYVKNSGYPLSFFGVSTENWKAHLKESLIWTILFLLLLTIVKWLQIQYMNGYQDKAIIDIDRIFRFELHWVLLFYGLYIIFSPIQEFITRGVYQTGLQKLFSGKYATFNAIVLSNLLFSSFHLVFNLYFAIVTFIPGIFWGYMYDRQKTLVGVGFSHILIGVYSSFLGFH
ncbi:MAG: cyclic nucleotide-binding domain-containing protein [Chitinophagales bacterium]